MAHHLHHRAHLNETIKTRVQCTDTAAPVTTVLVLLLLDVRLAGTSTDASRFSETAKCIAAGGDRGGDREDRRVAVSSAGDRDGDSDVPRRTLGAPNDSACLIGGSGAFDVGATGASIGARFSSPRGDLIGVIVVADELSASSSLLFPCREWP
jgi:hypothetical protein